jgi:hypothetical protein
MSHHRIGAAFWLALTLAACSADRIATPSADLQQASGIANGANGTIRALLANYVAIGTSVSMGWRSDGVFGGSQADAWPAQLAAKVGVPFSVPSIQAPGCKPPLAAPLIAFKRIDGSSAIADNTTCAPNEPGITLPTHLLAVENATAAEALHGTPETASQGRGPVTSRVLPSGMTQVSTMVASAPTFVSAEFGGNELLPAQVGLLFPGVTITPFAVYKANLAAIVDQIKASGAQGALLVSVRMDIRNFPTLRTGPEIASQRAAFAAYNVNVSSDCDASPNYIFVRGMVLKAILTGAALAPYGMQYTLSCANIANTVDYVLTPDDIAALNGLIGQMSDEVDAQAAANGWATIALGEVYEHSKDDVPFDLVSFLTSAEPYGHWVSLDGVHPSAAGQKRLAQAAFVAIQRTYGTGSASTLIASR